MPENENYAMDFGPFAGRAWFNTAHQGPLPKVAVEAAEQAVQQRIRPSEIRDEDFFEVPRRQRHLAQAGIDVAVREGNLRIAPHLHNTSTEAESLLHALAS